MANKQSLMWAGNGETLGVEIDFDAQTIYWFEAVGCACSTHTNVQSFADFREHGARLGILPEDVQARLAEATHEPAPGQVMS